MAVGERHAWPVIVSGRGTVRVWDLESGKPVLGPLTGHDGWVHAVTVGERHSTGAGPRIRGNLILRIELEDRVLSVASAAGRLSIGTTAELLQVDLL